MAKVVITITDKEDGKAQSVSSFDPPIRDTEPTELTTAQAIGLVLVGKMLKMQDVTTAEGDA